MSLYPSDPTNFELTPSVQGQLVRPADHISHSGHMQRRLAISCIVAFLSVAVPSLCKSQWARLGMGPISYTCFASTATRLYAGTLENGVFESSDWGTTWKHVDAANSLEIGSLLVTDTSLLIGTLTDGVFLYRRSGADWAYIGDGLASLAVYSFLQSDSGLTIFAATSKGVFLSRDDGRTWDSTAYMSIYAVTELVNDSRGLFAASIGGMYYSSNSGVTWQLLNVGTQFEQYVSLIIVDSVLVAATGFPDQAIVRSFDHGKHWESSNVANSGVRSICSNGSVIFATLFEDGVWYSTDLGSSWNDLNTGLSTLLGGFVYVGGGFLFTAEEGKFGAYRRPLAEVSPPTPPIFGLATPNPFSTITHVSFRVLEEGIGSVRVFDDTGRNIQTLMPAQNLSVGLHELDFDARSLASGLYLIELATNAGTKLLRVIHAK